MAERKSHKVLKKKLYQILMFLAQSEKQMDLEKWKMY